MNLSLNQSKWIVIFIINGSKMASRYLRIVMARYLIFEKQGKTNKSNCRFQFWQHKNCPILLDNLKMYNQRLDLHENPVRAGFVEDPQEWLYNSAIDHYIPNGKGLSGLTDLD